MTDFSGLGDVCKDFEFDAETQTLENKSPNQPQKNPNPVDFRNQINNRVQETASNQNNARSLDKGYAPFSGNVNQQDRNSERQNTTGMPTVTSFPTIDQNNNYFNYENKGSNMRNQASDFSRPPINYSTISNDFSKLFSELNPQFSKINFMLDEMEFNNEIVNLVNQLSIIASQNYNRLIKFLLLPNDKISFLYSLFQAIINKLQIEEIIICLKKNLAEFIKNINLENFMQKLAFSKEICQCLYLQQIAIFLNFQVYFRARKNDFSDYINHCCKILANLFEIKITYIMIMENKICNAYQEGSIFSKFLDFYINLVNPIFAIFTKNEGLTKTRDNTFPKIEIKDNYNPSLNQMNHPCVKQFIKNLEDSLKIDYEKHSNNSIINIIDTKVNQFINAQQNLNLQKRDFNFLLEKYQKNSNSTNEVIRQIIDCSKCHIKCLNLIFPCYNQIYYCLNCDYSSIEAFLINCIKGKCKCNCMAYSKIDHEKWVKTVCNFFKELIANNKIQNPIVKMHIENIIEKIGHNSTKI